ncbi:MAG: hypothetical protein WAQ99_07745, partial [Pyrinomonadaceae bacterium]
MRRYLAHRNIPVAGIIRTPKSRFATVNVSERYDPLISSFGLGQFDVNGGVDAAARIKSTIGNWKSAISSRRRRSRPTICYARRTYSIFSI